jgi:hypothetical protein
MIKNMPQLTEQDVLSIKRMRTPSSTRLQNNILNLTQELPQYTDQSVGANVYNLASLFEKVGIKKVNFWRNFKPYAATVAAGFAVIALSSSLWLPNQNDQLIVVDSLDTLSVEQLAEEIEWQDLMLLQDELAFAGL